LTNEKLMHSLQECRIESGKLERHAFVEWVSHVQHRNGAGTSFKSQRQTEPVKGACGGPDLGNGMRWVREGQEERAEGGTRQSISYKYEMLLQIKTSNFPI
jgi:hypothetical protein